MSAVAQTTYSESDYLLMEEKASYKSEYFRGEIFMMAGGTPSHNRIKENLSGEIHSILKGRQSCRSYSSDQRIHIPSNTLYTYPDLVVVCGPDKFSEKDKNSITNPTIIIEVLSAGSTGYDRGDKFRLYRDIDSLQEYILINSLNIGAEVFRRTPDNHWLLASEGYKLTDSISIKSLEASLLLSDIYDRTQNVLEGVVAEPSEE
ncbi:Uma2 family endonuclease [Dyadobacter arcticus]|uniref:Uma2 family endonuclease n=1 Tax=Dyadobacter arcticus TaxID=1078754 RepID=A0ABX0UTW6_9BACT|nr:Uma2 family endonuclease [Dyadobacter arcticus]NIJ55359.1 Uma2 family endonuclease [Dyadobacter arcticus]